MNINDINIDEFISAFSEEQLATLAEKLQDKIHPTGDSRITKYPISFNPVSEGTVTISHSMGKAPTGFIPKRYDPDSRPTIIKATKSEITFRTKQRGQTIEGFLVE